MGLFDFLRPKPPSGDEIQGEQLFVVPLAARKFPDADTVSKETYLLYAFLFANSAEDAVTRLRTEVRGEGLEFIEVTGKISVTSQAEWSKLVSDKFDWIKDALPTAQQLAGYSRCVIHYSPKITRL